EIDLQWHCRVPDAAGCFIDSNSGTNLRFELLGAVLSPVTTFDHRELKPDTRYGYRIIPFFGPPSDVVKFTTGESAKIAAKAMNAVPGRASPGRRGIFSVRSRATAAKAAPSDLTATGLAPRMAELKWRDNSRDEEGYLVEVSEGSPRHFRVMAVLRPNTISFPTPLLPPKTACYFRVRAYCTGGPSLALELTTHPR
ncbi:MAG: fibronectin type III domain-containing protein, partial [Verrucomicrobia bacterium]|nr:fibronectin type III domain-containing protein [Verrucomicrobiota bacterium]